MVPPFFLFEDLDLVLFSSLESLVGWVEAIDVRNGEFEAFDGTGQSIELTAESDNSRVVATAGKPAPDRLKTLLASHVTKIGPHRLNLADVDLATVDLAWLVRSVAAYHAGGRGARW